MMKRILALLAIVFAADSRAQPVAGGTVTGRVRAVHNGKVVKRDEVWVYLEALDKPQLRAPGEYPAREIRQQREQFVPHVLVVPVGTTVWFPNFDREEHNVFSPTSPTFDLGRYNTDKKGKSWRFDDPGEHAIYCDVHKQMWARVKVVHADTQLIAPVAGDGTYAIHGIPPGKYKVHAWSYASAEVVEPVVVSDGGTATVPTMNLQLDDLRPHQRIGGSSYPP
jgi:plastocyanin